ncbi:hypothetical protein AB0B15_12225 [Streptomyces sp. NPDC045456]|uniref:hypothetical protein n=1 Tax=Streptomyces sp. NPDC045456 TaxID=3155254 RepID=UPI0033DE63F5
MSYHEYRQARLADGSIEPHVVAGVDLTAMGVATGGALGRAEAPGPGWQRLRWADLARRVGDPVAPEERLPSYHCFPSAKKGGSWPLSIVPPTEGSTDRDTWNRLIALLVEYSPDGADTCLAYYNPMIAPGYDFENLHVRAGRLGDAHLLYDNPEIDFSPSNLWAADRSWVLCTDYDLWATKVCGPRPLIDTLLHDTEIEAVQLPNDPTEPAGQALSSLT